MADSDDDEDDDSDDEDEPKVTDFKRPKIGACTQTEVDEHGLWDRQDGWVLPISGTVIARRRWRDARAFVKCPSCRGIGAFVGCVAKLLRNIQRGEQPIADTENVARAVKWSIPDDLVAFMGNVPRSAQAIRPKNITWVLRRVYLLLAGKTVADREDDKLGYALQSSTEYLVEAYLLRAECRSEAELEMYVLLSSLKEIYHKHALLHTFGRFLGVVDAMDTKEVCVKRVRAHAACVRARTSSIYTYWAI